MLFGLTRDFVQQDGIRMVLGEPGGIPVPRLNTVQSRMLSSLSIPHHLRLFLKEMDLNVTLEYSISGKKLLSHLLKGARLTLAEFYGLLLQIAQGMEDGRLHMLRPEQYALHADYIFVEGTLQRGKVYLTYVPIQLIESPQSLGENLKGLVMELMPSVTELKGDGVQRLLHYCGGDEFTALGWKELLSALLTEKGDERYSSDNAGTEAAISSLEAGGYAVERYFHEKASNGGEVPLSVDGRDGEFRRQNGMSMNEGSSGNLGGGSVNFPEPETSRDTANSPLAEWMGGNSIFQRRRKDVDVPEPDNAMVSARSSNIRNSSMRTYILLGCILLDALLWKYLYLDHPGRSMLIISGIVTVILLAISGFAWMGGVGRGRMEEVEIREEKAEEADVLGFRAQHGFRPAPPPGEPDKLGAAQRFYPPPIERGKRVAAGIFEFGTGEQGIKSTEDFPKGPESGSATVLLPKENVSAPEEEKPRAGSLPYLERTEEGSDRREVIELNRASFIIGRSPEVAQYVETSDGTSRVHAEVFRSGGRYVLKDLDSRNGTRFQGETTIPYKEYPLTDGDAFTIIKGNYTFHQR